MEYQSEQVHALYPRYAILMKSSARAITGKFDVFIKEISILLNDSKKHAELVTYVESFREKLRKEQDTFCLYENAVCGIFLILLDRGACMLYRCIYCFLLFYVCHVD